MIEVTWLRNPFSLKVPLGHDLKSPRESRDSGNLRLSKWRPRLLCKITLVRALHFKATICRKKPRRLGRGLCGQGRGFTSLRISSDDCAQRYQTTSRRAEQINFRLCPVSVHGSLFSWIVRVPRFTSHSFLCVYAYALLKSVRPKEGPHVA